MDLTTALFTIFMSLSTGIITGGFLLYQARIEREHQAREALRQSKIQRYSSLQNQAREALREYSNAMTKYHLVKIDSNTEDSTAMIKLFELHTLLVGILASASNDERIATLRNKIQDQLDTLEDMDERFNTLQNAYIGSISWFSVLIDELENESVHIHKKKGYAKQGIKENSAE